MGFQKISEAQFLPRDAVSSGLAPVAFPHSITSMQILAFIFRASWKRMPWMKPQLLRS
jgi:hypothetical protein